MKSLLSIVVHLLFVRRLHRLGLVFYQAQTQLVEEGFRFLARSMLLLLLLLLMLLLLLVSPLILYRPFMAWISSLIGRSGLLKTAFAKTEGNYWRFVAMAAIFNVVFVVFEGLDEIFDLPDAILMLVYAPLLVYVNVATAKTYEFFFLDNLED